MVIDIPKIIGCCILGDSRDCRGWGKFVKS